MGLLLYRLTDLHAIGLLSVIAPRAMRREGQIDLHSKTPSHDGATALHLAVAHVNYLSVKVAPSCTCLLTCNFVASLTSCAPTTFPARALTDAC